MKILVAGDLYPCKRNTKIFEDGSKAAILNDLQSFFDDSDFRVVNLECCISDEAKDVKESQHVISSRAIAGIKAIGVDLLCLGNNHLNDIGYQGVKSTIDYLNKNGIKFIGVNDLFHYSFTKDGIRIAIINIANKEDIDTGRTDVKINFLYDFELINYVQSIKSEYDHIIVIAHEGTPYYPYPFPRQQEVAHHLVAAGANIVIYQSSHAIGAVEKHKDGVVFYGQGNFIFDNGNTNIPNWNNGFLIMLSFSKSTFEYTITPYTQSRHGDGCRRMNLAEQSEFDKYLEKISEKVYNKDEVKSLWVEHSKIRGEQILANLISSNRKLKGVMRKFKLMDYLISVRTKKQLLNYLECSHNNAVMTEYLRYKVEKK